MRRLGLGCARQRPDQAHLRYGKRTHSGRQRAIGSGREELGYGLVWWKVTCMCRFDTVVRGTAKNRFIFSSLIRLVLISSTCTPASQGRINTFSPDSLRSPIPIALEDID